MKRLLMLMAVVALLIPFNALAKMKAPDVLDKEKILTEESLSKYKKIGVKVFSTEDVKYENVDDEEMKKMKRTLNDCREKLANTLVNDLKDSGVDAFIIDEEGKNADKADMIIDGKITKINLGSGVARFFVGFGAGSAGVSVEGELKDAKSGDALAKFEHENTSGLRETHDKWEMVLHESQDLGDKLAEFVQKLRK
jgi:hypothetical protein